DPQRPGAAPVARNGLTETRPRYHLMLTNILRTGVAAAVAAALLAGGAAIAQNATDDTSMSVSDRVVISGQDPDPVDFPGLRGDKPGQPLPKGYAAVGYRVTYTRGAVKALPS